MINGSAQWSGPSVFSRPIGWNLTLDSLIAQKPSFIDNKERLLGLFEETRAINITVFKVRCLRSKVEAGDQVSRVLSTASIDQEGHNFGLGGLILKEPFSNLQTKGCLPTQKPSIGFRVADREDRCWLRVWY